MQKIEVIIGQRTITLRAGKEELQLGGGAVEGHALDIVTFAQSRGAEVVVITGDADDRLIAAIKGVGLEIEREDASE